jgi:hypothetical protein
MLDALRSGVFAFRGVVGGGLERPIMNVFNMDVEEFDARFRVWLRKKYEGVAGRGTPREFGRTFYIHGVSARANQSSPAISPSHDLVAAFTTYKGRRRGPVRHPRPQALQEPDQGLHGQVQYLIAQGFTTAPKEGRDLLSPDGDRIAVFARAERTRSLLLLDTRKCGIAERFEIPLPIDQPSTPAFSPDGRTIAFSAIREGTWDIYLLDRATGEVSNLTNDEWYDAAPAFRPNGTQLVYTSEIGEYGKLVGISLADPSQRQQRPSGQATTRARRFGGRPWRTSPPTGDGIYDIYKLDARPRLERLTNVYGGAVSPVPADTLEGSGSASGYHRGRWDLYAADAGRASRWASRRRETEFAQGLSPRGQHLGRPRGRQGCGEPQAVHRGRGGDCRRRSGGELPVPGLHLDVRPVRRPPVLAAAQLTRHLLGLPGRLRQPRAAPPVGGDAVRRPQLLPDRL